MQCFTASSWLRCQHYGGLLGSCADSLVSSTPSEKQFFPHESGPPSSTCNFEHYAVTRNTQSAIRSNGKPSRVIPVSNLRLQKLEDRLQLSSRGRLDLQFFTGCSSVIEDPDDHNKYMRRQPLRELRILQVVEKLDAGLTVEWEEWCGVRENISTVLVQFLETKGLDSVQARQALQESSIFIEHLLSLLRSCFPARYLSGQGLTGSEVRSVLLPYLDNLSETQGQQLDILVKFPTLSADLLPGFPDLSGFVPQTRDTREVLSGYPLLLEHLVDEKLPSSLSYFLSIGLTPAQVDCIVRKFPPIVAYSFEGKIQKVVDYLLSLGLPSSHIPKILVKRPHLFGCSVEENLKPAVKYFESLGVERKRWPRIMGAFPHVLTYSQSKTALIFNFLLQVGFTGAGAGKVLSRFPHVVGYSVEGKLKPLAEYFHSIGIEDFCHIVMRHPQTLGLSLECNIKPTVDFLLSLGFDMEELAFVLTRFPQILGLNVEHNLQPKWNFFLKMNRSRSELVDFPQFFGYSLEKRIEPRYKVITDKGLPWTLNRMLSSPEKVFQKLMRE